MQKVKCEVSFITKEGLNDEKDPVARQELQALSTSIKNLLAQWFAVGLLDLKQVTWDSPGSILEKVLTRNRWLFLFFLLLLLLFANYRGIIMLKLRTPEQHGKPGVNLITLLQV